MALEVFRKQQIKVNENSEFADIYILENLFPVLLEGLEALSREIEVYFKDPESIDVEIRRRFNPCIYLAQFLMRNNPKYNKEKLEDPSYKYILEYVKGEKFMRYFQSNKVSFLKLFLVQIKKEKPECDLADLRIFAKYLDT